MLDYKALLDKVLALEGQVQDFNKINCIEVPYLVDQAVRSQESFEKGYDLEGYSGPFIPFSAEELEYLRTYDHPAQP